MDCIVVGAGVSGLSCAIRLLEAGHPVRVLARELPPRTTSNVAAAFWYPYRAEPARRVHGWAADSYREFERIARTSGGAGAPDDHGITFRTAVDVITDDAAPWWTADTPVMRAARPDELPVGARHGWAFRAPVIDTRRYMPWLVARVRALGASVERRELAVLPTGEADVVVNCSGLGAREIAPDASLYPVRGQLVHVQNPGVESIVVEHGSDGITYVVPRGDECVLGATSDEGDDATEANLDDRDAVLARCRRLIPALERVEPTAVTVGLRPGRATVRLELELRDGGRVVHNYGHGGAGVTLSWGCASEAAVLAIGAST